MSPVGLKPALCDLKAFGTDGEQALSNALWMVFKEAKHLHFLHFTEDRLKSLHIQKSQHIEFLCDAFGNPAEFEELLVDADNENVLISLQEIWNNHEREFNDPPAFTIGL